MFVSTYDVSAAKRVIATLLATAVVMWTIGLYSTAEAANIKQASDLMTDTAPAALSNHTITFTSTSGVATTSGQVVVTFPSGFDLTSLAAATDFGITVGGTPYTVAAAPSGANWGVVINAVAGTLTFSDGSVGVQPGQTVVITIGTNTSGGVHQIINPTPIGGDESFEISISAGTDLGYTRVVILSTTLVTANVATTFSFTVTGLATSTSINGTSTTGLTGSTSIPFGQLVEFVPKILGQRLNVSTNAANGFVVTVHDDGDFRSSTGATIHNFKDGNDLNTPITWAAPSNLISSSTTWGHWGMTSSDHFTGARSTEFATDTWIGVSTTPRAIFGNSGPSDGVTKDIGSSTVAYKAEISPLQPAADDYATILTYVATPTF